MSHENGKMAKGLMVGFIAGSVAGAVLALLYAPKSGKDLRQDIIDKSDSLIDNADEYLTRARSKAVDVVNEGKQRSENVIRTARKRAETLMSDVERIIADAS
jgi:gas vesicle protein